MSDFPRDLNPDDGLNDLLHEINQEIQPLGTADNPGSGNYGGQTIVLSPHFSLSIMPDQCKAWLKYSPVASEQPPSIQALALLTQIKQILAYGIDQKAIQKILRFVKTNPEAASSYVIAEGRPPLPPTPPVIQYWIGNEPANKTAETIFARKNDLLLHITPPFPGVPGIDVFGKAIPPPPASAAAIVAGPHVKQTSEGEYYALVAGSVCLSGDRLWIIPQSRDAAVSISLREDEMEAYLSIEPAVAQGRPITWEDVTEALNSMGIRAGIMENAIHYAIRESQIHQKAVENRLIARGKPSTPGQDEMVTWHIDPQSPAPPFTIKEDGSVDFHNLKKIISVKKDDLIVTVTPATPGLPGFTVTGQSLPGIQGKKTGIVAGEHIDKQAKQHDWLAAVDGYLFFIDQVVSVHSILTIAGDVDFSTGNIDFLGDVYIVGNVLDEFTVKASGSIFIGGSVEAAQLEAGHTICVQQGVFGKEKGRVHAQQDIIATFYQNARVEAGRDVIAGNQILNSRIKARRHIIAKTGQGRIIGGELLAGHTLTAKQIGSDLGTRTTIETGLDYHILDQMTRLGKKRDTLTRQAAQLADWIKKNKGLPTEPINPNFLLAQRKQVEIQLILDQIQSEYQELSQSLYPPTEAQITALGILIPDVYIKIRDARTKVISPHTHCTVKYNPESERIELRKFKIG